MLYARYKLLLVFTLITLSLHGDALVTARSRIRKNESPKSISRASVPDIPPSLRTIQPRETAGSTALAMIHFPWQDLGFRVSFLGRRPGYRALTLVDKRQIEVYVKSEDPPGALAFDLAHEFGHAFDLRYNDAARKKRWLELRGIDPSTPWYGCNACSDYATPAGDFAETFAYLLLGPGNYHSRMAPAPSPEAVRELAEFCHIAEVSDALVATENTEKNGMHGIDQN